MGDQAIDTVRRLAAGLCVLAAACNPAPIDDTDNLFPAAVLGYPSDAAGGAGDPTDVPGLAGDAVGESGLDGTYRLSCIKIEELGSVGADASAIEAVRATRPSRQTWRAAPRPVAPSAPGFQMFTIWPRASSSSVRAW